MDLVYPCLKSRKEIRAKGLRSKTGDEFLFPEEFRPANKHPIPSDFPGEVNWRFRVEWNKTISFFDQVKGMQQFVTGQDFSDFLVWRKEGVASYELATVVDDYAMDITEIVRGEDLLLSSARQCLLAEIVEMMCTATIVHDSVLEDDEESMLGNVAHRTYSQNAGNKVSVLAGDFLLARCSVALSQLGDLTVVELMATALESIVQGGVLKAQARQAGVAPSLSDYEGRVRLKTASLIADACRSAAILAGEAHDSDVANAVYDYATALGLSYQVMFDTIRYHQILELAHVAESDVAISERILQEFISSPPVILSEIADVNAATTSRASLKKLSGNVEAASGLNHAVALSKEHAERAKSALGLLPESREKQALLMMADFVSQEDQVGLQREKYVQSRADAAPV